MWQCLLFVNNARDHGPEITLEQYPDLVTAVHLAWQMTFTKTIPKQESRESFAGQLREYWASVDSFRAGPVRRSDVQPFNAQDLAKMA